MKRIETRYNGIYACGEAYEGPTSPPSVSRCGFPLLRVTKTDTIQAPSGFSVTGTGILDTVKFEEGSTAQAAIDAVLAESLPAKIEPMKKLGALNDYELDVIDRALRLLKLKALEAIARQG